MIVVEMEIIHGEECTGENDQEGEGKGRSKLQGKCDEPGCLAKAFFFFLS